MNDFFKYDTYICDEKIKAFKSYNSFMIYDTEGNEIGQFMHRTTESGFFGRQDMLICDSRGGVITSFRTQNAHEGKSRFDKTGWRYILILDANEKLMGKVYSKSITTLQILDQNDEIVIQRKGGWTEKFLDKDDNEINAVAKEKSMFAGAKSIFTKAHKWKVEFSPDIPDSQKELIKSAFLFTSLSGRANTKGLVGL